MRQELKNSSRGTGNATESYQKKKAVIATTNLSTLKNLIP